MSRFLRENILYWGEEDWVQSRVCVCFREDWWWAYGWYLKFLSHGVGWDYLGSEYWLTRGLNIELWELWRVEVVGRRSRRWLSKGKREWGMLSEKENFQESALSRKPRGKEYLKMRMVILWVKDLIWAGWQLRLIIQLRMEILDVFNEYFQWSDRRQKPYLRGLKKEWVLRK